MNERGHGISRTVQTTDIRTAIEYGVDLAEGYTRTYVACSSPAADPRLDSAAGELRARKARRGLMARIFRREAK